MNAAPLTLGTAGHIDHGKTALVRVLTGRDTDRLPQEHERGISIELGFAALTLPSGRSLSVVDVPGHERFVRTMVAGASGIDVFLMAVAADDGVMRQSREHVAVLRALGVELGVVAVTKSDLADPGRALAQAGKLLPGAEAVPVSARTGEGLAELLVALDRVAERIRSRAGEPGPMRLHVDRVFTVRGAGTVVTGTLWAGELGAGDRVRVLPGGRTARVRGVQVHDRPQPRAVAGQRVAVNLAGVSVGELHRGDVLVAAGRPAPLPTHRLDCELDCDPRPEPGERVTVHHGTREAPARMVGLGEGFWQLRLERPLVTLPGERVVVRRIAPPDTLGGGRILDADPARHGPSQAMLHRLHRLAAGEAPSEPPEPATAPQTDRDGATEPPPLSEHALQTERLLREAGLEPASDSEWDGDDLAALRAAGRAVRVARNLHLHVEALEAAQEQVVALARRNGGAVTLPGVRDELGTSRRYAQALLEHLDSERVLIRRGDLHVLRGSSVGGATAPG